MVMIKSYLTNLLKQGKREDGRKLEEYREIEIIKDPIFKASGSARVKIGKTDVIVGVMMDVSTPFPDGPEEGILMVNSELSPLASAEFETGPPSEDSIELARVMDRMIRESKVIDVEKLCIKPREKVWTVYVDFYPVNADGNLLDAGALAAMIALNSAKMPKYNEDTGRAEHGEYSGKKLPVKTTPMMCTFGKIDGHIIADLTEREEKVMDARITVATTDDGHIHAMQKGGVGTFTQSEIFKTVELATELGKKLRKHLK